MVLEYSESEVNRFEHSEVRGESELRMEASFHSSVRFHLLLPEEASLFERLVFQSCATSYSFFFSPF